MALNIKDRRTDELAREVAALSGKGITEALRETLELRLVELEKARDAEFDRRMAAIRHIQAEFAAVPVLDARTAAEITDELDEDVLASH